MALGDEAGIGEEDDAAAVEAVGEPDAVGPDPPGRAEQSRDGVEAVAAQIHNPAVGESGVKGVDALLSGPNPVVAEEYWVNSKVTRRSGPISGRAARITSRASSWTRRMASRKTTPSPGRWPAAPGAAGR